MENNELEGRLVSQRVHLELSPEKAIAKLGLGLPLPLIVEQLTR
jgi:hypothetical protein